MVKLNPTRLFARKAQPGGKVNSYADGLTAREKQILDFESRLTAMQIYTDRGERPLKADAFCDQMQAYLDLNKVGQGDEHAVILRPFFYTTAHWFLEQLKQAGTSPDHKVTRFFMYQPMDYRATNFDEQPVHMHLGIAFAHWMMQAHPGLLYSDLYDQHLRQVLTFDNTVENAGHILDFLQSGKASHGVMQQSVIYALMRAIRADDDSILDHIVTTDIGQITPEHLDRVNRELSGDNPFAAFDPKQEAIYADLMQRSPALRSLLIRYGLIQAGFNPMNTLVKLTLTDYREDVQIEDIQFACDVIDDRNDVAASHNLNAVLATLITYRPDLAPHLAVRALNAGTANPSDPLWMTLSHKYADIYSDDMLFEHFQRQMGSDRPHSIFDHPINGQYAQLATQMTRIPSTLAILGALNLADNGRDPLFHAVVNTDPASINTQMLAYIIRPSILNDVNITQMSHLDTGLAALAHGGHHNDMLYTHALNAARFISRGNCWTACYYTTRNS